MGKNKEEPIIQEKEITIPEFVCLKDKYKCFECKLNKYNVSYKKRLQRLFATCSGKPSRRTQCKKRFWFFTDLFSIVTAIIVVIAFFCIYSHFQKLLISIAWTIIFAIGTGRSPSETETEPGKGSYGRIENNLPGRVSAAVNRNP